MVIVRVGSCQPMAYPIVDRINDLETIACLREQAEWSRLRAE